MASRTNYSWVGYFPLTSSVLLQVTAYTTSLKIWTTLQEIFSAKSRKHNLQLRNQLTIIQKIYLKVDEYLAKLTSLLKKFGILTWQLMMVR